MYFRDWSTFPYVTACIYPMVFNSDLLLANLRQIEQHIFLNSHLQQGHHWEGFTYFTNQLHNIKWDKLPKLIIFLLTECFCNFIITKIWTLLLLSDFSLQNFYSVYVFRAALHRLLLELWKCPIPINKGTWFSPLAKDDHFSQALLLFG
jgi:hypothetical protein